MPFDFFADFLGGLLGDEGEPARRSGHSSDEMARESNRKSRTALSELDALRQRVGKMELLLRSMAALMIDKGHFSGAELRETMEYVDAADGKIDGMVHEEKTTGHQDCHSCGRRVSRRQPKCYYCGSPVRTPDLPDVFEDLPPSGS